MVPTCFHLQLIFQGQQFYVKHMPCDICRGFRDRCSVAGVSLGREATEEPWQMEVPLSCDTHVHSSCDLNRWHLGWQVHLWRCACDSPLAPE